MERRSHSVEDDATINQVLTAEAVLAEQNLILKRTAFSLTVEGELPRLRNRAVYAGNRGRRDRIRAGTISY